MSKSLVGTLLGLAVVALIANSLEASAQRFGVWSGYLLGAGVGCAILGWQSKAFQRTPHKAMQVLAMGFMLKLTAIAVMGVLVFTVPAFGDRIDAFAFLAAGAGGMFLLLALGTVDNAKVLEQASREAYARAQAQSQSSNTAPASGAPSHLAHANPGPATSPDALTKGSTSL